MKAIRAVLLGAACTAVVWAAALVLFGGFNARLFGIAIRSNNPDRVVVIACIALAGYFVAGGRIQRETVRRLGAGSRVVHALIRRPGVRGSPVAPTRMGTSARPTCGSPVIS